MSQVRLAGAIARCVFTLLTLYPLSDCGAVPPIVTDSLGQTYRLVEANHFEMGAAGTGSFRRDHSNYNPAEDEQPIHPVILTRPFYVATTEVTVAQFGQFVEATGYVTTAEKSGNGIVGWDPVDDPRNHSVKSSFRSGPEFNWRSPGFPQADSHPVVGVSFEDAKVFCRWLSENEGTTYRLPTEAEWECACRAGTDSHFSFGEHYRDQIHQHANVGNVELERAAPGRVLLQWLVDVDSDPEDGHVFTSPVGSYHANPWGIHDLHGNVWEWCEDRYLDTYYTQFKRDGHRQVRRRAIDPSCDDRWNEHGDWRVIRGGSWFVAPIQCRSGVRGMFEEKDAACYVGFRLIREADESMIDEARKRHERSEAALAQLKSVSRSVMEDRDGHIQFELTCDDLNDELYQRLQDLAYSVEIQVGSPGRLSPSHLSGLARTGRLAGLTINVGGDVQDDDFEPLASHPELSRLQITGTVDLGDGLVKYLAGADRLESINLQGSQITDEGLSRLPALARLHTLHLASTQSAGGIFERCSASPLREVSFGHLDDANAERLSRFPTIRNLDLRSCSITARGLKSIASLRQLSNLNLEGCSGLSDEDFRVLAALPQLSDVNLLGTGAGDQAVHAMRELLSLRSLRIGNASLSDAGTHAICEIVSLQTLALSAEATNVSDAGLADFWRLVNLRELTIDAAGISGAGFAPLTELTQLQRLNLGTRQLNDVAMQHIAKMGQLTEVVIGARDGRGPANLTGAGLLLLAQAPELKKVTVMRRETNISDDAIERLKELKPELELNVR